MLALATAFAASQAVSSRTVPKPAFRAKAASDEELQFSVRRPLPPVTGLRVFLNPSPGSPLTAENPGYVGMVSFSEDPASRQSFTLPLPKVIHERSQLMVVPIGEADRPAPSIKIAIRSARIVPADNSAFR